MRSNSTTKFDLSRLIAPISVKTFQEEYWEQRPLVIRREHPGYYDELFGLQSFDEIVVTSSARSPNILVVKNGQESPLKNLVPSDSTALSLEHIFNEYRNGATLVLPYVHERWPTLTELCAVLSSECSSGFQVNAYLTPRRAQGFGVHYDTHDVFILQIEGSKKWRLFDSPMRLPLQTQPYRKEAGPASEPTQQFVLHAGDLLYLPRGVVHEALAEDEMSLHLTVGILPITWAEVIRFAVEGAFERDAVFRESLPLGFAADNSRDVDLERQLKALVSSISTVADYTAAVANAIGAARLAQCLPLRGHLRDLDLEVHVSLETLLMVRDGLQWWLEARGDEACLLFHGKEICMPSYVHEELSFICSTKGPFTGAQLPGRLNERGRLTLIRRLLREGFLTVSAPRVAQNSETPNRDEQPRRRGMQQVGVGYKQRQDVNGPRRRLP
jgi:ribosomal protein L16 Arg81 hydroxylase